MLYLVRNDISNFIYLPIYKLCLVIAFSLMLIACGGSGGGSSSEDGVVQVAGTITVQRDSDIDLDLNSNISLNNQIEDPQLIVNPSTIGGYLSGYSGTYSSTDTRFNIDQLDYFKVSLVKGQELQLSVFQADSNLNSIELELVLLDESQQAQASLEVDLFSSDTLTVPADGLYTLKLSVSDLTSPLLYTLSLSQKISSQSQSALNSQTLAQDFVPGEVLLRFKDNINTQSSNKAIASSSSSPDLINLQTEPLIDSLIFKESIAKIASLYQFKVQTNDQSSKSAGSIQYIEPEVKAHFNLLERKKDTLEYINKLNASGLVEFAEPNFIYHSTASTDDPRLSDQWNLSMLATHAAWEVADGQGVVVAVLDTGINPSHEDLINNIHPEGYDFISDNNSAGDGGGFDDNPNDEGTSFHGSHVAGIIAAEANNAKGVAGLAYASKIMALRVLGVQDSGSSSDIAQAILYAAGFANASGEVPVQRADIINMSFGSEAQSATVKNALDQAYSEGLVLVAASGNAASDKAFYPAAFDNVIGVGAVSNDKKRSSFSNFGVNVSLVAPGGTGSGSVTFDGFEDAILSTVGANNYAEYIGTSMAAPHVSAIAALMKQLKPDLSGQNFKAALEAGFLTQNLTSTASDTNNFYGKGLIDAAKSVNWAAGSTVIPGILTIFPTKFGFIGATTKAELSLSNSSYSQIKVISVDSQENWLNITAKDDVDISTGLGTYLVEVNLALTSLGQGNITINYQIDNEPVQQRILNVFVSRSSQTDPSVGNLFVSLYKEEDILNGDYKQSYGIPATLTNGVYEYCINYVAPGRYLLTASTDNDGDRLPFDEGEAVGSFPLLSRPSFIEVSSQSLLDMNFDIQHPSFSSSENGLVISRQQNTKMTSLLLDSAEWSPLDFTAQSNCLK